MEHEKKNYYEILDIAISATPGEVETAYVRARNAYSGDSVALYSLMTKDECNAVLSQIEEAYSVIGFPEKRREYDKLRGFNRNLSQPRQESTKPAATIADKGQDKFQYESFGSNLQEAKVSKISAQKKFGLEYDPSSEMDERIANCVEYTGKFLKEIREYKNVTIERIAEMTRISKTYINALENEDLTKLPAEVYVRGYVYQVAKVLKLNPDQVAASYILHFKKLKIQK